MRNGWVETKLGHYIHINTGKLDVNAASEFGDYPFFTCSRETYRIDEAAFEGESVLVAGNGDLNVKYYDGKFNAYQRTYVLSSVDRKTLDNRFLFLFMQTYIEFLRSETRGTVIQYLKKGQFTDAKIKLPPLPEQKRIVDLISSVDSYIEALQQQLESAKNSKSAYVNTIVSEIFARGKKTKIADIAEVKGGKRLPKGTPWSEEPTDHRYIRATDIKDGIVLTENLVYVPDDVWPLISRYVVNQGDVVITIAGTIGQVGVIPTSLEGVNLTENAAKIVVNKKLVRSNYLSMLLGSNYYQQDIDSKTKKTTQPKLGLNMINSIEIPLPDLAEQDEIFSVVSQIDTLIAGTNNLILQTIALRTGLLSDLLSGVHEIPASYDKVIGAA